MEPALIDAYINGVINFAWQSETTAGKSHPVSVEDILVRQNRKEEVLPYYNSKQQQASAFLHPCATYQNLKLKEAMGKGISGRW